MTNPRVLLVLDGWGYRSTGDDNAIIRAHTPVWDQLWQDLPHTLVSCSGPAVGLPDRQMGNSEVGHMNLGAGRIIYQELTRIGRALEDGSFAKNPVLADLNSRLVAGTGRLHLLGLLSSGGVHSHEDHIVAAVGLAIEQGVEEILVHPFLDGRDTPPRSARLSLERLDRQLRQFGTGRIATLIGRYYAMDRDGRWDRTELAYRLLTENLAEHRADNAVAALEAAYARGESDEFVKPTLIAPSCIEDGDGILFMNLRADRMRQLVRAFSEPDFSCFHRPQVPKPAGMVTLTEYAADLSVDVAYPPNKIRNSLGEYLAGLGKRQLRIAETEKYAHVTFFFSAGREKAFPGEDRVLVPSPKVATYDLQPEMSAPELTDKLTQAITTGRYDFIVCNYANADMVGHTGDLQAAIAAVECVDQCIGRVVRAVRAVGGECLITADHGNVERMLDDEAGQAHTAHTSEPVPLLYVGERQLRLKPGSLCDIAPTLLDLMDLPQPQEMTGKTLIAADLIRDAAAG